MLPDSPTRKIILLGDAGVGKTSVMFTCIEGTFRNHFPTVGMGERTKAVDVNGTHVILDIWDTAGQERHRSQVRTYVTGAAVAVLMFDVNDPLSLQNLVHWVDIVKESGEPDTKLFIVGNKSDLGSEVSQDAGEAAARKFGAAGYFETSAASNIGIETLFTAIAVEALKVTRVAATKVKIAETTTKNDDRCC
jgi:small GTP-binding protein